MCAKSLNNNYNVRKTALDDELSGFSFSLVGFPGNFLKLVTSTG